MYIPCCTQLIHNWYTIVHLHFSQLAVSSKAPVLGWRRKEFIRSLSSLSLMELRRAEQVLGSMVLYGSRLWVRYSTIMIAYVTMILCDTIGIPYRIAWWLCRWASHLPAWLIWGAHQSQRPLGGRRNIVRANCPVPFGRIAIDPRHAACVHSISKNALTSNKNIPKPRVFLMPHALSSFGLVKEAWQCSYSERLLLSAGPCLPCLPCSGSLLRAVNLQRTRSKFTLYEDQKRAILAWAWAKTCHLK